MRQNEDCVSAGSDYAQIRMLGREGIVGHLGVSVGKPTQERRFTRIRQSDQTGVGDYLQLEDDPTFFAGGPRLGFTWGAVSGGGAGGECSPPLCPPGNGGFPSPGSVSASATIP